MRTARQEGLLDPLIERLEKSIADNSADVPVEGPEWPYKRAKSDGRVAEAADILAWIERMSKPSPDGAQNTEE